ncbi:MAG: UDP-N-acetylmuramate dehydrogenase [Planctomycetes bacterium]|nr:UDP-N-acetylmuramate dehydrogenase [Planctomycetota bacterium]
MIRAATGVGIPMPDQEVWSALAATRVEIRPDCPLGPQTTIRLGGVATALARPRNLDELVRVLKAANELGIEVRFLGAGSNLVVVTDRVPSLVIHTKRLDWIVREDGGVRCGGGANLVSTIRRTVKWGLAGLEGLAGIPATVGGAVAMNAGGKYAEIAEFVRSVTLLSLDGTARDVPGDALGFRYRGADLGGAIVAEVRLALAEGVPYRLRKRFRSILAEKAASQPLSEWTAGCVFKNPGCESAGRLIDRAGLKGSSVGGAAVSQVHANFIVNTGQGKAQDFVALAGKVQATVASRFGVELEPEVVIWS